MKFFTLILSFLLASCASKTILEVAPEDWTYHDRAIHIHTTAPTDLNSISGRPHTLMIGVFQLNDPNTFQGLSATREGAVKLLNEGRVDDTVAQFDRLIIQSGEEKVISIDRAQSSMYVGLISGYFGLNTELDVHIFNIPVKAAKRGAVDLVLANLGLIADEAKAIPDEMYIDIALGRKSTREINLVSQEDTKFF